MVDSILAKFELTPDTPAVTYSNAAVAFQHQEREGSQGPARSRGKEIFSGAEQTVCRIAL